jgi:DNA polymerase elongation subunit (family B)
MFFDEESKPKSKAKLQIAIDRDWILSTSLIPFEQFTDDELIANHHSILTVDVECYENFFLISFKNHTLNKVVYFEMSPNSTINYKKLEWVLWNFILVGFNSTTYDLPMIFLCLKGFDNKQLKTVSDRIINEDLKPRGIENEYQCRVPVKLNHIDLIEVAPLSASLKTYAGRLHCQKMQDLPFDPNIPLTEQQAKFILHYNINDLDNTWLLFQSLEQQIKLRCDMSEQYSLDLRSRSDAQIAEHVIASEVAKINKSWPRRPVILEGQCYRYAVPSFLAYATAQLQGILAAIANTDFVLGASGAIEMPDSLKNLKVIIGNGTYRMGIGGLHSSEEKVSYKTDENHYIIDRDVASYYPAIILNQNLAPKQMGKAFIEVYKSLVDRRLKAKRNGDKVNADSLKIVINGSFGKLGSKYSCLYSPDLLLQVTLTGQLALLMLIEGIESVGISVISANTDGILIKCPKSRYEELNYIIKQWETVTQFETEETKYKAVYSRDVNNYIAIKEDFKLKGNEEFLDEKLGCKTKGTFSERGSALNSILSKNPEKLICMDAILQLLTNNIPIEQTIYNCNDVKRFIVVRNVKGGAHKNGRYLGKVVRWYYSKNEHGTINYILSGNKVPNTESAKPMMDLALSVPEDLNFDYYINETLEMLYDLGYYKPKQVGLF